VRWYLRYPISVAQMGEMTRERGLAISPVEQDHRNVKRRTWLAKGYGSVPTAWRTLRGIEAMDMIRKGRVRRAGKADVVAQMKSISKLFGIAA